MYRAVLFLSGIILLLVISGYSTPRKNECTKINSLREIGLSESIERIFQVYLKKVHNQKAYAICIFDWTERMSEYAITFVPFSVNVAKPYDVCASKYLLVNDSVPVFIYYGTEDFESCDFSPFIVINKKYREICFDTNYINLRKKRQDSLWSIIYVKEEADSFVVRGDGFEYPFYQVPSPTCGAKPDPKYFNENSSW